MARVSEKSIDSLLISAMSDCGLLEFAIKENPEDLNNLFETLKRVKVTGKNSKGEKIILHLTVKSWKDERNELVRTVRFPRGAEAFTYRRLLPAFKKYQTGCARFSSYPTLVGSSTDPAVDVLILEDIKSRNYCIKNLRKPLDFRHLEEVVKELAHFHAISLSMKLQYPCEFRQLRKEHLKCSYPIQPYDAELLTRTLMLCVGDEYTEHRRLLKKFAQLGSRVLLETTAIAERHYLSTFCHGNANLCNILFEYGDKTKPDVPTNVCLIDFQMLCYSSPVVDLSYFIFTATDKETRDKHYDDLVAAYYREVCTRLSQMGSSPAHVFPYDYFQYLLRRFSVLGYFMAQMTLYTILRTPSVDITADMNEEDIMASFSENPAKVEALYDQRIKEMLIDFVDKGYFDFLDVQYQNDEVSYYPSCSHL